MISQGYQWIDGFNNAAGLTAIEDDVPVYQHFPLIVRDAPFNDGLLRPRADKLRETTGFQTFDWLIDILGEAQYRYIQDTYTVGGTSYSGKMTVRTRDRDGAFANYSAVLHLPMIPELRRQRDAFRDVVLHFVVEEAL